MRRALGSPAPARPIARRGYSAAGTGAARGYTPAVLKLLSATRPEWAPRVAATPSELLIDHAHCEKKAAGAALRLLFRYPHHELLQAPLSALAREELGHFEQVLAQLARLGIAFTPQRPSPYAGRLHSRVRAAEPARLTDTLLCCAVIEARSSERLALLADAFDDPGLARFYRRLAKAEQRHHRLYVELAAHFEEAAELSRLLEAWPAYEAEALAAAPRICRLHGA